MKTTTLLVHNSQPASPEPYSPVVPVLLSLLMLLFATQGQAATYYVGTARAYTNLQSVVNLLVPGDVVEVDGDATYEGNIRFNEDHPGTSNAPITILGVRVNGRRPLLSGTNLPACKGVLQFAVGADYYHLEGFEISGGRNSLVTAGLYNAANGTVIRDTLVRDCAKNGILGADASGLLTLDKVEVRNSGGGTLYHQIYVGSDNLNQSNAVFRMQFCYVHDGKGGNNVKSRVGRSEIYYNWIETSYYHELDLIGADPTAQATNTAELVREDADVVGNVFYKHSASRGVAARLGNDGTGSSDGRYRFVNNTIVLPSSYSTHVFRINGPRESVELHNNVIYRNGGGSIWLVESTNPPLGSLDGFYGNNNWLPTNSTYIPAGITNTLFGTDPRFANVAGFDFMPGNASPLLDASQLPTQSPPGYPFPSPLAAPLYLPPLRTVPYPLEEIARPSRPPIDIGAFESIPLPPIITKQPTNQIKFQGQAAVFAVSAAGSLTDGNPLTYQWYSNSLTISDATNATYTIPLVETNHAGSYLVLVTNLFGSITSSTVSLVINLDTNKPSVTITSPLEKASLTTNQVWLKGNAADNVVLGQVLVKLNSGGYSPATVSNGLAGKASWSLLLDATPGTNTVWVYGNDPAGNVSSTNSRTFFYALPATLIVSNLGEGTLSPNYNGSNLFIGRNYTMTAAPANTNWLFTNWLSVVEGETEVATSLARYTFAMQTNLTLVAQFVTNRFIAAAGSYNGLFWDTNSGVLFESAGFINLKSDSRQKFSGNLSLAGEKRGFSGAFNLAGDGENSKPIAFKANTNTTLKLYLHLPFDGSDKISGVVSNTDGSWVAQLSADKAGVVTNYAGQHTMILPGSPDPALSPGGDGYGLVTVTTNGNINLAGALGDGTAISQKVPVSGTGEWPLFISIYPTTNNNAKVKGGLLMGWMMVTNGLDGTLHLIKTPVPGSTYPAGFTNLLSPSTSSYTNSALFTNRVIELTDGSNGVVILSGGNLTADITNGVTLSTLNKFKAAVTNMTGQTNKLALSVAVKTGKVTGSFKPDGVTIQNIAGAVLQNADSGQGYFKAVTNTGAFKLDKTD